MASDVWPTIHSERKALAADLDGVSAKAWDTPSLCDGWTVRDVVAHMTAATKLNAPKFFGQLIGSGFSFEKVQAKGIAANRGTSPEDTLANFKAQLDSTGRPPGPVETMFGESIIHAEDIRRPLGIQHTYPTEALVQVADFMKKSNLIIGTKKRVAGLSLEATDVDWRHGDGPTVSGPMLDLLMAMTGRKAVLGDLTGDGVATLASRS
ncbi:MAG: maleylpyruvate isomerase family mycothiol-dependent enzyme [Acidimicrobiia bacterium]|nr:maleylpyruvate isomerase family mycothiol-dependent enzyme [Acidimicrobiia bacterium]